MNPLLEIGEVRRQAIIETAEALNYLMPRNRPRPHRPQASSDHAGARIGIVHFLRPEEELADPYYIGVRMGIEARARANRVEVQVIYRSTELPPAEDLQGAAGIIALGMHTDAEIDWVRHINANLVLADFAPNIDLFDIVACDLSFAMARLLDRLHAAGYRRFGFLGDDRPSGNVLYPANEERARTFREWTEKKGLFNPAHYMLAERLRFESGYRLACELMAKADLPEIVVTSNDNVAIGAYRAIQERGLRIPDDIGIASFNDIPVAQFLAPPLTTIRIHAEHIGETAVDLLFERLAGRAFGFKKLADAMMAQGIV